MFVASQSPYDCCQGAQTYCSRNKHIGDIKKYLAEVGKMLVSGIVLKVRICHKRNHTIKNRAWRYHRPMQRVQRHPFLESQDKKAEDEQRSIENQQ
jgi:hypothetical protein